MAAFLVPLESGACVIPLEKAILLIGRQADCDVSLTASRKISRKHCCIAIVNDTVVVRDLGSTNGVSINGQRIDQEGRIRLGDELSIGDVRFRLQKDISLPAMDTREAVAEARSVGPDSRSLGEVHRPTQADAAPPSLDFPVALAEDGRDFDVDPSLIRRKPATSRKTESSDSGPLVPFASPE